jgi:hypothetical protein
MTPYADTNFFTRIYLELPESEEAERFLSEAKTDGAASLPLTWLHRVELLNAFQLHVFQARHKGQTLSLPRLCSNAIVSGASTPKQQSLRSWRDSGSVDSDQTECEFDRDGGSQLRWKPSQQNSSEAGLLKSWTTLGCGERDCDWPGHGNWSARRGLPNVAPWNSLRRSKARNACRCRSEGLATLLLCAGCAREPDDSINVPTVMETSAKSSDV